MIVLDQILSVMFCTSSLLIFVHSAVASQEVDSINKNSSWSGDSLHDYILCRSCGNEITISSSLISKISPFSQYSYIDSIFNRDGIVIQVLMSDFVLSYPMITTNQSNCVGISEWEEAGSWFPGYRWKPCVCPDCGALVGWVFEAVNFDDINTPESFFGLILTGVISEFFINSVIIVPGDQSKF